MKRRFGVLAICESGETRKLAEQFCTDLQARFWEQIDVTPFWFSETDLSRATLRRKATELACASDMLLFALTENHMTPQLSAWIDSLLEKRGAHEGYLVLLTRNRHTRNEHILRSHAHNWRLDFLTELPPSLSNALPESPESYTNRAQRVTALLADILRPPVPPLRL